LAPFCAAVIVAGQFLVVGPANADPKPYRPGGPQDAAPAAGPLDPRAPYRQIAREQAERLGVPFALVDAVMAVESDYNPLAAGRAGEIGLMQVMPETARLMGFSGNLTALARPEINIPLGARYLAEAYRLAGGDICTTVMKYRAGHQETRFSVRSVEYCRRVRTRLAALGYPVTGSVPEPTFGFRGDVTRMGVAIGSVAAARRHASGTRLRSRVGWGDYTRRTRALDRAASGITLQP